MNVEIISEKKSQIEFEITLPHEEFEPSVKRAAALFSEEKEFEGFRKGKAPYDIIKKEIGEHAIYERGAEVAIRKIYSEALAKALTTLREKDGKEKTPIGPPEITVTKLAPGNELIAKVRLSLLPDVILPDYRKEAVRIRTKEKKEIQVTDGDVTRAIDWVRESRATEVDAGRAAQKGDSVEVDFEIEEGGRTIEGGESHNHPLIIGKGKFIPGFEDELIGMTKNEQKSFSLIVPDTWHDKALHGKTLNIRTTLKEVRERTVPELTDDFVKTLGDFPTKEKFEESVREGLTEERKEKEKERIRMQIIQEIAAKAEIDIPELLIETELTKMLDELKSGITQMGMKWDEYLSQIKKAPEELRVEWREEAEKRVRVALSLKEIAEKEDIRAPEEEVEKRSQEFLSRYKTVKDAEEEIDPESLREYTRGVVRNEKVFAFLETVE